MYDCRKILRSEEKCEKVENNIIGFLYCSSLFFNFLGIFKCTVLCCTKDAMLLGFKLQPVTAPCLARVKNLHFVQNFMSES